MAKDELEYESVVSTNISAIAHDAEENALYVVFTSGAEWQYDGISRSMYESLRDSGSVGGYFSRSIRGQYAGRKIG